jgi:hypothetical protein
MLMLFLRGRVALSVPQSSVPLDGDRAGREAFRVAFDLTTLAR